MSHRGAALVVTAMVALAAAGPAAAGFPGANGRIAYASDEYALSLDIFTIRPGGGKPLWLARSSDNELNPAWSPNGNRIAYQRNRPLVGSQIWIMKPDGSGKTMIAAGGQPAWSPDGSKIAYVGADGIHVMNADGSGDAQIHAGAEPAWSPDATQIAYSLDDNIHVMDIDGDPSTQLTFDGQPNRRPDWSPNGEQIVFSRASEIAVIGAGGGTPTTLTTGPENGFSPAWSPNGAKIVFETGFSQEVDSNLWVMNPDGSNQTPVTDAQESAHTQPDWQPRLVTLTASKTIVRYGGRTTLTAHLALVGSTTNLDLTIYKTPYGGTKTEIKTAAINGSGDLSVTVEPKKKTLYTVKWEGDATHEAATETLTVQVRSITRTRLSNYYAISSGVRLYHLGDNLVQRGCVIPNHAGKRITFYAQRKRNGNWDDWATGSFRMHNNGCMTAVIGLPVGSYRVRNSFGGDADHLGSASPWTHARVTS